MPPLTPASGNHNSELSTGNAVDYFHGTLPGEETEGEGTCMREATNELRQEGARAKGGKMEEGGREKEAKDEERH